MTDSAELLPCGCPFCGAGAAIPMTATKAGFSGVEVMRDSLNRPFVWCGTCGAQARWENTEAEAIAAWNTRAPVPASPPVEGEDRAVAAIEATGLLAGDEARDAARAAISALSKPRASREEIEAAFLVALAEAGIPPDVQELLVQGNPSLGVRPGALGKAIALIGGGE